MSEKDKRDQVLVIRITTKEKAKLMKYAKDQCVNLSALVRKLLFKELGMD